MNVENDYIKVLVNPGRALTLTGKQRPCWSRELTSGFPVTHSGCPYPDHSSACCILGQKRMPQHHLCMQAFSQQGIPPATLQLVLFTWGLHHFCSGWMPPAEVQLEERACCMCATLSRGRLLWQWNGFEITINQPKSQEKRQTELKRVFKNVLLPSLIFLLCILSLILSDSQYFILKW